MEDADFVQLRTGTTTVVSGTRRRRKSSSSDENDNESKAEWPSFYQHHHHHHQHYHHGSSCNNYYSSSCQTAVSRRIAKKCSSCVLLLVLMLVILPSVFIGRRGGRLFGGGGGGGDVVGGGGLVMVDGATTTSPSRRINPEEVKEMCKNFTHGNSVGMEFYSPMYPHEYPPDITCFRTITASVGHFVRMDFRDVFKIEPPSSGGKCEYDYLEIRDGDQGYSPLIGKYCGNQFPPIITSSGRSLWLRFRSDSTIQYMGFKAVYTEIQNPQFNNDSKSSLEEIGPCAFEASGHQDFFGTDNITETRRNNSLKYDTPIDCVWTITAENGYKVYLQFREYQLDQPNDCHLNYIQIFDGKTDTENMKQSFCGSIAESWTSSNNVVYVRFYAEKTGINSKFVSVFTIIKEHEGPNGACDPKTEYDCEDATCIHPDLVCNGIRNCKFGWDEEACVSPGSNISLDFSSPHVIIIIIILVFILIGMGFGMVWSFKKVLEEDRQQLEDAAAASLANAVSGTDLKAAGSSGTRLNNHSSHPNLSISNTQLPPSTIVPPGGGGGLKRPPLALPTNAGGSGSGYPSNDESGVGNGGAGAGANGAGGANTSATSASGGGGNCYVPDGGFPFSSRF